MEFAGTYSDKMKVLLEITQKNIFLNLPNPTRQSITVAAKGSLMSARGNEFYQIKQLCQNYLRKALLRLSSCLLEDGSWFLKPPYLQPYVSDLFLQLCLQAPAEHLR
ncbi:Uncharacterized protein Adt_10828 [Abeliophyllum distichum]|uniref:Uncharacterized protein n=1 Tax=Abeliophyllum distichum TaxID=126358 RepID=A0ABD1UL56_9LAMI